MWVHCNRTDIHTDNTYCYQYMNRHFDKDRSYKELKFKTKSFIMLGVDIHDRKYIGTCIFIKVVVLFYLQKVIV